MDGACKNHSDRRMQSSWCSEEAVLGKRNGRFFCLCRESRLSLPCCSRNPALLALVAILGTRHRLFLGPCHPVCPLFSAFLRSLHFSSFFVFHVPAATDQSFFASPLPVTPSTSHTSHSCSRTVFPPAARKLLPLPLLSLSLFFAFWISLFPPLRFSPPSFTVTFSAPPSLSLSSWSVCEGVFLHAMQSRSMINNKSRLQRRRRCFTPVFEKPSVPAGEKSVSKRTAGGGRDSIYYPSPSPAEKLLPRSTAHQDPQFLGCAHEGGGRLVHRSQICTEEHRDAVLAHKHQRHNLRHQALH